MHDPTTLFSLLALLLVALPCFGMAINLAKAGNKLQARGQAAGKDYTDGVSGAGGRWQQNTAAAADNWAQGVNQAVADGRFGKGVASTSPGDYENAAKGVGSQRFTQGIATAGPKWEKGFAPTAQAMDSVQLPPRRPRGDPSNLQRVAAMNTAARQAKVGR